MWDFGLPLLFVHLFLARFLEKRSQLTGPFARESYGEFWYGWPFICNKTRLWLHAGLFKYVWMSIMTWISNSHYVGPGGDMNVYLLFCRKSCNMRPRVLIIIILKILYQLVIYWFLKHCVIENNKKIGKLIIFS